MMGRLIVGLALGLVIFVLACVLQALLLPGTAGEYSWWMLVLVLALALFVALRARTVRAASGHLFFINGILGIALAAATLLPTALSAQEEFRPEIISEAAVRYLVQALLLRYGGAVAFVLALLLIVSSVLLLRSKPR